VATIVQTRSTSATAWGALIGAILGWLVGGPLGAVVGFIFIGAVAMFMSLFSGDSSCSDCGGKLPSAKVKTCKHCRADLTGGPAVTAEPAEPSVQHPNAKPPAE